jgi:hypothetical protein
MNVQMPANADHAISTNMYENYDTSLFPLHASQFLAISIVEYFALLAMQR